MLLEEGRLPTQPERDSLPSELRHGRCILHCDNHSRLLFRHALTSFSICKFIAYSGRPESSIPSRNGGLMTVTLW